jgi:hypothetical protein
MTIQRTVPSRHLAPLEVSWQDSPTAYRDGAMWPRHRHRARNRRRSRKARA